MNYYNYTLAILSFLICCSSHAMNKKNNALSNFSMAFQPSREIRISKDTVLKGILCMRFLKWQRDNLRNQAEGLRKENTDLQQKVKQYEQVHLTLENKRSAGKDPQLKIAKTSYPRLKISQSRNFKILRRKEKRFFCFDK